MKYDCTDNSITLSHKDFIRYDNLSDDDIRKEYYGMIIKTVILEEERLKDMFDHYKKIILFKAYSCYKNPDDKINIIIKENGKQ